MQLKSRRAIFGKDHYKLHTGSNCQLFSNRARGHVWRDEGNPRKKALIKVNGRPPECKAGNKLWFAHHLLIPSVIHLQLECHRFTNRSKSMNWYVWLLKLSRCPFPYSPYMKVSQCFWNNVSYKIPVGVLQPMVVLSSSVGPCEWWELNFLFLGFDLCHVPSNGEIQRNTCDKRSSISMAIFTFPQVSPRAMAISEKRQGPLGSLSKRRRKRGSKVGKRKPEKGFEKGKDRGCEECHQLTQ